MAKYYFLQGVNLVVIAGPSLEMMVCKCRKTLHFSIWRLSVWEGRVSPVMFFVSSALWVPPHNANIVLPKTCFWERVGTPTSLIRLMVKKLSDRPLAEVEEDDSRESESLPFS